MAQTADDSRTLGPFVPVLALLAVCMLINYIDRGNLSIAAPLLKEELGISASQLGVLLSGFFWTYTVMQFVGGWLVDRFSVNVLIAAGYLLWPLATASTGLVRGFTMLLAMRLMLGHRRIGGVSVSLQNPGAASARRATGIRQRRHNLRRAGWRRRGCPGWRPGNREVRLAACLRRTRTGKSALASCLDAMEAVRRNRAAPHCGQRSASNSELR